MYQEFIRSKWRLKVFLILFTPTFEMISGKKIHLTRSVGNPSAAGPQPNMRQNRNRQSFVLYVRFSSYRGTPVSISVLVTSASLRRSQCPSSPTEPGFRLSPERRTGRSSVRQSH